MRIPSLLRVFAGAIALSATATAQLPAHCVETFFASDRSGGDGWAVMFDVDTTETMTISGLRTNFGGGGGQSVAIQVWTAPTSFGNETNPAAWIPVASASASTRGEDQPTWFTLSSPLELPVGTTGVAIVHLGGTPSYTEGNGSNEVHTSPDGHVTITANAAVGGTAGSPFTGPAFQTRVWNGNLCYDLGTAPCVTTLFDSDGVGAFDSAVYFNVRAFEPATFSAIEVNAFAVAGASVGLDVYVTDDNAQGKETDASAWTLVASDDGTAVAAGFDVPTRIPLDRSFQVPTGRTGIALVARGFGHRYTTGAGTNGEHRSADDMIRISAGSATNVPFVGPVLVPRIFNGRLCRDTPEHCVETVFDGTVPPSPWTTVYFNVVSPFPFTATGFTASVFPRGELLRATMWTRDGTFRGHELDPNAWTMTGGSGPMTVSADVHEETPIVFSSPVNFPAGRTGVALRFLLVRPLVSPGSGSNQVFQSGDDLLRIEAGSMSTHPFGGTLTTDVVWNGKICYSRPFIGNSFCDAVPNSTGEIGKMSAVGSYDVTDNTVRIIARDLPAGSAGFFLTSQSFGFVQMPGGSDGNLCIVGPSIGRFVGPGQVQNSGSLGAFSLALDLTRHPTPTGFVQILPGDSWNFQCWHRDVGSGGGVSNFTNALRIRFE